MIETFSFVLSFIGYNRQTEPRKAISCQCGRELPAMYCNQVFVIKYCKTHPILSIDFRYCNAFFCHCLIKQVA